MPIVCRRLSSLSSATFNGLNPGKWISHCESSPRDFQLASKSSHKGFEASALSYAQGGCCFPW
jgi:hypothetical protein